MAPIYFTTDAANKVIEEYVFLDYSSQTKFRSIYDNGECVDVKITLYKDGSQINQGKNPMEHLK